MYYIYDCVDSAADEESVCTGMVLIFLKSEHFTSWL